MFLENIFFIEPYCEFLTCLYFNEDIYFIFNSENKADFDLYILNIYKISKNIINNLNKDNLNKDNLNKDDFINLFLRIDNKNNSVVRLNNKNNSVVRLNNKNNSVVRLNNKNSYNELKNFYKSIKKNTEKNHTLMERYKEKLSEPYYAYYSNNNSMKRYGTNLAESKYDYYRLNNYGKINKTKKIHSGITWNYMRNTQQLKFATNRLNDLNK
jgi:hypothetical protein